MGGAASYFRLGHPSARPLRPGLWLEAEGSERTMAAACFRRHGSADCLELTDRFSRPSARDEQVLVRVFAASVNPVDLKLRAYPLPPTLVPLPKITGTDFAGVVQSTDQSPRSPLRPGDRVMGAMPLLYAHWGSTCEFVCVSESLLTKIPDDLSFADAASLPLVGMTVVQALQPHEASLVEPAVDGERKTVLIQGGAGGVGTFAIQYCANHLQLEVFTTCSPRNNELVTSLGANHAIDYHQVDWCDFAHKFDLILDTKAYIYEEITEKYQLLKENVLWSEYITA